MTEHDDDAELAEFTDGLRASLADDRLALRPTAAAKDAIVAAARRRRRQREIGYATGGSLAVAAALAGGLLLAAPQPGTESSMAQDAKATSAPPAAEARSEAGVMARQLAPSRPVWLGPRGYGVLRLGMSYAEIRQTGMLAHPGAPPPTGCARYRLAEAGGEVRDIVVSARDGLAVVTASTASTPEGVSVGSAREQVERSYAVDRAGDAARYTIATGAGGYYRVTIGADDRVSRLQLVNANQDCG